MKYILVVAAGVFLSLENSAHSRPKVVAPDIREEVEGDEAEWKQIPKKERDEKTRKEKAEGANKDRLKEIHEPAFFKAELDGWVILGYRGRVSQCLASKTDGTEETWVDLGNGKPGFKPKTGKSTMSMNVSRAFDLCLDVSGRGQK